VVAHAFDPSTREAEAGGFLSSRPAWSSSRTARAIQRNPVSKKQKNKKTKKKNKQKTKNGVGGTPGERAQWLREAVFSKNLSGSVPSTNSVVQQSEFPLSEDPTSSSGLCKHQTHINTCRQNTHIHKIK
jgi:hypothetical protein